MSEEWRPGQVALVEAGCWANRKVALRLAEGWSHENGVNVDGDGVISVVRPLVTIDPENSRGIAVEIAQRVGNALHVMPGRDISAGIEAVQEALREFADPKPPKPEEPMGLGAVIEAADGRKWVRDVEGVETDPKGGEWYSRGCSKTRRYADIDAVKVLSEGVR